jgi:hypothetical protein
MHPVVSLTGITLGLITAFLMFFKGWDRDTAGLIVSGISLMLVLAVLGVVLALTPRGERADFLSHVLSVMNEDLDDVLQWFHLKQ